MSFSKVLFLNGPAGKLEAIFNPAPAPQFLAVVCHPHPLYQGTMHNKVVVTAARTLHSLGGAVLRFNFRGVMASEGQYDNGIGEQDDVQAAVDFLHHTYSGLDLPTVVAGFSFGAWVGLSLGAREARVSHLIAIGLPTRLFSPMPFATSPKPKLFIHGKADTIASFEHFLLRYDTISEPKTLYAIEDADHFFTSRQDAIQHAIAEWLGAQGLSALPPPTH